MQVVGLEGQVSCLSDYLLVCSKLRGLYWGAEIRILACQEDVFCLLKETLIFNGSLVVSDQQWQWWHWQGLTVKICTAVHIMPSLRKLYRVHTVYTHSLYLYLPQSPPIWPGFTSNYAKSPALDWEWGGIHNQDSVNILQQLCEESFLLVCLLYCWIALKHQ